MLDIWRGYSVSAVVNSDIYDYGSQHIKYLLITAPNTNYQDDLNLCMACVKTGDLVKHPPELITYYLISKCWSCFKDNLACMSRRIYLHVWVFYRHNVMTSWYGNTFRIPCPFWGETPFTGRCPHCQWINSKKIWLKKPHSSSKWDNTTTTKQNRTVSIHYIYECSFHTFLRYDAPSHY